MRISDWSSDVCSSDLLGHGGVERFLPTAVDEDERAFLDEALCRRAADAGRAAGDHGGLSVQSGHVMGPFVGIAQASDYAAAAVAARSGSFLNRSWKISGAQLLSRTCTSAPPSASLPRLTRSEEHTSELQSLMRISYAVFCLKKKKKINN